MDELVGIAIRVIIFYAYTLAAVRLSGKRSIGQLTILDFIIALIVGDLFDDIFWGDEPFANGLVALTVLILLHMSLALLGSLYLQFSRVVLGEAPVQVIKNGKRLEEGMRRERASLDDIHSQMRLHGEEKN